MPSKLESLTDEAQSLIQRAHDAFHPVYGFSTTSCQVYDTAWAAMICKRVDGEKLWLFPESFRFLLREQAEDGSWGRHSESKTVGVLDTAAAVLALLRHSKEPLQMEDVEMTDLSGRINRGVESLRAQLTTWDDIMTTNHIGVELIVPALLSYLTTEDQALNFEFESKEVLMQMYEAKMNHFNPESLYKTRPSSALHSLEAFISKIDFDRVGHHLFNGSMLASPSSTAAFLICASSWSDEAEAYLQHIFNAGTGQGAGGFPGTYSTAYFEFNWMLSTLLRAGFSSSELKSKELFGIADIIIEGFRADHGVIGFAPRAVDVDDTAKGLLTLSLLEMDECVSPAPMIALFEADDHFRTFLGERDPSFTSNCHVLLALLHRADKLQYVPQIKKAAGYLCEAWWRCDGLIKDKWHLSHLYPTMLLAEAFTDLIYQTADDGPLQNMLDAEMISKAAICLFQACFRTMLGQGTDGSWGGKPEETSYAILTLVEARRLVLFAKLQTQVEAAIGRGIAFLKAKAWTCFDHSWTSKTAYRATIVAEAYLLAAVKAGSDSLRDNKIATVGNSVSIPPTSKRTEYFLRTVGRTGLFSTMPEWEIQASFIESALFVPLLRAHRQDVYDRDDMGVSEDHYLDIIPFTWIGCNNRSRAYVATSLLFDLMTISMLGYQTDEFIEAIAAPAFAQSTRELHDLIDSIVDDEITALGAVKGEAAVSDKEMDGRPINRPDGGTWNADADGQGRDTTRCSLRRFVHWVIHHQHVRAASVQDQVSLWHELRAFLHAHAVQVNDNANRLERYSGRTFADPGRTFFDWVRTTAADHVACAYSFSFACCLMSAMLGSGNGVFTTVKEIYLAQAACRHMATMCRMYNDVGSVSRDLAEGNTNSVDFPEFASILCDTEKKRALAELGAYEHSCLIHTIDLLQAEALRAPKQSKTPGDFRKRKMDVMRLYADVTDFYDQLYVLRDLSSTMKETHK